MQGDQDALKRAAREWFDTGFSTLTTHSDGRKRPAMGWEKFQVVRPEWTQISQWLTAGRDVGIGVVLGAVSGNREMLEIEGPAELCARRLEEVTALAREVDCFEVLDRILRGLCEISAGDGLHMFLEVTDGECRSSTQLAFEGQGSERHVVAETRGEGGFAVVAPTSARKGHVPGKSYRLLPNADPSKVAKVTVAERDKLYAVVSAALNEPVESESVAKVGSPDIKRSSGASSDDTPWGDWAAQTTWREILEPMGWSYSHADRSGREHWTRPGKEVLAGTSATTLHDGPMYVFTSSSSLPVGEGMSKFFVYAQLHHGGDMPAAARSLRDQGYGNQFAGDPLIPLSLPPVPMGGLDSSIEYDKLVRQRLTQLKVAEDAKQLFASERAALAPTLVATSLTDFLSEPDIDQRFRVQGLWPSQGRVLFAAAAKSGKTTMVVGNLLPSLVDAEVFLGSFESTAVTGRVAYFNMEVGENVIRQWLRDVGIVHTEKVLVSNLRGRASALSLDSDAGRQRLAATLRENDVEVVILDPLAPLLAALGIDENSNSDVARFFAYWNEALTMGGVREDLIVHHTGHSGQRSRGASRLLDEPDAIWTLTKAADSHEDDEDAEFIPIVATRHLTAYGRDVDLPPTALAYEESNRRLMATGPAPRKTAKKLATAESQKRRIIDFVAEHPGANTRRISNGAGIQKSAVSQLLHELVDQVVLDVMIVGNERLYTIASPKPDMSMSEVDTSPVPETQGEGTGDDSNTQNLFNTGDPGSDLTREEDF